jgi:hypothetical protein
MARKRSDDEFSVRDKVVAAVDLPGVPRGTPGKVTLKNGFRWIRYRVRFDNGADIGSLDRSQLAPFGELTTEYHQVGGTTS